MTGFNPLDHPACLLYPLRLVPSAFAVHIPLAFYMVDALRPRVIVELGTTTGVSYCAFCQAVKELGLNTRLFAVSSRESNSLNGFSAAPEMLNELKAHHDSLYGQFSSLIQSSSDGTFPTFDNGTIDLLHFNGYQSYVAIKHDFELWLPKMSEQGVILIHNIRARRESDEVWKLWHELKVRYPSFEFVQEHGLGLISIGRNMPKQLGRLLTASEQDQSAIREFFAQVGQHLRIRLDHEQQTKLLSSGFRESEQRITSLSDESRSINAIADARLKAQQEIIEALSAELTINEDRLYAILNSRAWRWVSRYGRAKIRYFEPPYTAFRRIFSKWRASPATDVRHSRTKHESVALAVPKTCQLEAVEGSLVLLPEPKPERVSPMLAEHSACAPRHRPDIVCFSIINWDFRYQRPQQIMSQFAVHGHRVFYIKLNSVLPLGAGKRFDLREIKKNVYEVTLSASRSPGINQEVIRGTTAASLLNSLNALRRACHIDEAIGYVMTPSWSSVAISARTQWGWRLIYDCMDDWEGFPGMARAVTNVEHEVVSDCDLLVVSSAGLSEKWRGRTRPATLARNAVDFEFFAERCLPNALLDSETRPVIGYYGAIADWFDSELVAYVASRRPGYLFVLIGGIFDVDVSKLKSMSNVRFLGQQPYRTMPLYLYHFAACLIPFKLNAITHATDPVKMYEYLSAGKPIVSVALTEIEPFSEYLYFASDYEDFINQLDRAVAEDDEELRTRRREFARRNTWTERYETISRALSEAIPRASIIIVTFNNLALNKLCLESILRNTEHPNYEVIVVDNNSSDGTPTYLRTMEARHSHFHVILNPGNYGFARATNQGVAISSGLDLVFLNNDTVVPPGWLSRILKHLDDPQVGMVGPVTNFVGNEAKIEVPYKTWAEMESFAGEFVWAHDGQVADIRMLAMFCVALRRKTYNAIGPLDEQFGIGMFEDDDYTQRVKAAGLRVICAADVFVHHIGQASFRKLIEQGEYEKLFTENRRRYEHKWNLKWIPHRNATLSFISGTKVPPTSQDAN